MSMPNTSSALINGLRTEFVDIYDKIRIAQSDSRLASVMDLNVQATNRTHPFAWWDASPHMTHWPMGDSVPSDAFSAHKYDVPVHNFAREIHWFKWDRDDDQTSHLYAAANAAGTSAALSAERIFFDVLTNSTNFLPGVPLSADGVAMFDDQESDASTDRFGVSSGNLLSGSGITTVHDVQSDYYSAIEQFGLMQDGKGQPLLAPEIIAAGTIIIHAMADTQIMEQSFLQLRQGIGMDNTGARGGTVVSASADSNLIKDSSRNVELWGTPRLSTGDWYVFLKNPPTKPCFLLTRQDLKIYESRAEDNNSDRGRRSGIESIQFEQRLGGAPTLPYAAIQIDN